MKTLASFPTKQAAQEFLNKGNFVIRVYRYADVYMGFGDAGTVKFINVKPEMFKIVPLENFFTSQVIYQVKLKKDEYKNLNISSDHGIDISSDAEKQEEIAKLKAKLETLLNS